MGWACPDRGYSHITSAKMGVRRPLPPPLPADAPAEQPHIFCITHPAFERTRPSSRLLDFTGFYWNLLDWSTFNSGLQSKFLAHRAYAHICAYKPISFNYGLKSHEGIYSYTLPDLYCLWCWKRATLGGPFSAVQVLTSWKVCTISTILDPDPILYFFLLDLIEEKLAC